MDLNDLSIKTKAALKRNTFVCFHSLNRATNQSRLGEPLLPFVWQNITFRSIECLADFHIITYVNASRHTRIAQRVDFWKRSHFRWNKIVACISSEQKRFERNFSNEPNV